MDLGSDNLVFAPPEWSGGVIYPTRRCFDDALDYLDVAHAVGGMGYLLQHNVVHGICVWPGDLPGTEDRAGERFAHAWVELKREVVIQAGVCNDVRGWYGLTRISFYTHMRVQEVTRYSVLEALAENERTNHFGPWKPEYVELCRKPTI